MKKITSLSKHAEQRSQQRAVREMDRRFLDMFGDEEYAGNGCYRLFMSDLELDSLVLQGEISRQRADKIKCKIKIQDRDTDVTVANNCGSRKNNYKKWRNGRPCMWFRGKRIMSIG